MTMIKERSCLNCDYYKEKIICSHEDTDNLTCLIDSFMRGKREKFLLKYLANHCSYFI